MAKLEQPIVISGMELVTRVVKRISTEYKFSDGVSEDYKKGWNTFSKVLIDALENMQPKKEPPKSIYEQMREKQAIRYAWQDRK